MKNSIYGGIFDSSSVLISSGPTSGEFLVWDEILRPQPGFESMRERSSLREAREGRKQGAREAPVLGPSTVVCVSRVQGTIQQYKPVMVPTSVGQARKLISGSRCWHAKKHHGDHRHHSLVDKYVVALVALVALITAYEYDTIKSKIKHGASHRNTKRDY